MASAMPDSHAMYSHPLLKRSFSLRSKPAAGPDVVTSTRPRRRKSACGNGRTESGGPAFCVRRRCGRHCLTEERANGVRLAKGKCYFSVTGVRGTLRSKLVKKRGNIALHSRRSSAAFSPTATAAPGLLDCWGEPRQKDRG